MKVTDIFKVIIIAFLVITFTVSMISCKEAPVIEEQVGGQQEEEKAEVTIPSENKETVPENTTELEKIDAAEIPGLTFNQETKKY